MTRPVEQVVYIRGTEDEEHHPEHSNRYYINFPETWRTIAGRRLSIGVRSINYHRGYPDKIDEIPGPPSNPVPYYNFGFSYNVYFINKNNKPIVPKQPFIYDVRYGAHLNKLSPNGFMNMERYGLNTQWADQVKLWNNFLLRRFVKRIPVDGFEWKLESEGEGEDRKISFTLSPVEGYEGTVPYFHNFFDYSWDDKWAPQYHHLTCFSSFEVDYVNQLVNGHWYWFPRFSAKQHVNVNKRRKCPPRVFKLLIEDIRLMPGNGNTKEALTFNDITRTEPLIAGFDGGITNLDYFVDGLLMELSMWWEWWWKGPELKTKLAEAGIEETDIAEHQWRVDESDPNTPIFYLDYDRANDSTKWYPQVRFQAHNIAGINLSHFQIKLNNRDPWQPRLHIAVDKFTADPWESTPYIGTGDVVTSETAGLIPYTEEAQPVPQPTDTPVPTPQPEYPNMTYDPIYMPTPFVNPLPIVPETFPVEEYSDLRQLALKTGNSTLQLVNALVDMASRVWRFSPYGLLDGIRNFDYMKHRINATVRYNDKNGTEFGDPQRLRVDYTYPATDEFEYADLSTRFVNSLNGVMNRFKKLVAKEGEDPPTDLEIVTTKEGDTISIEVVPTKTPMTGSYPLFENIENAVSEQDVPLDDWTVTTQLFEHENGEHVELPVISYKEPIPDGYVEVEATYNLPARNNDSGIDVVAVQPTETTSIPTSRTSATMAPALTQEAVEATSIPTSRTSATVPAVLGQSVVTVPRKTVYLTASRVLDASSAPQIAPSVKTVQVSDTLLVAASFVSQTKDQYLGFVNSEYCPMKTYDITTGDTRFWVELYTADGKYGYELAKDGSEFITIELQLSSSV